MTVGRALEVLSDLDNNPPRYAVSASLLNTELAVYNPQAACAALDISGTELALNGSEATSFTSEFKKPVDGPEAYDASTATRDIYLANVSKLLYSSVLNLATECVKSTEST